MEIGQNLISLWQFDMLNLHCTRYFYFGDKKAPFLQSEVMCRYCWIETNKYTEKRTTFINIHLLLMNYTLIMIAAVENV